MARRSFCRLVLFLIFCYVSLILLFIAIPPYSPGTDGDYTNLHQRRLRAGKLLTSVYTNQPRLYYTPKNDAYRERDCFGIDWLLLSDVESNSITLRIGENARLNLTALASSTPPFTDLSEAGVFDIVTRPADYPGGVMLPWFNKADSCMLDWEVQHETKIIEVRAVVPEPGVVQIWPENELWHDEPFQIPDLRSREIRVFMTIMNIPTSGDRSDITNVRFEDQIGQPLSPTFVIRRSVFLILKPVTLTFVYIVDNYINPAWEIFLIVLNITFTLALVCAGISIGCWWSAGRPPFDVWARQYPLTKWLYKPIAKRVIWGPGGFVMNIEDEENGTSDEHDPQSTSDRTLKTPIDFFRTRSPLDDLLNTFESTRWMTRPLHTPWDRNRGRFGPSERRWSRAGVDETMQTKV